MKEKIFKFLKKLKKIESIPKCFAFWKLAPNSIRCQTPWCPKRRPSIATIPIKSKTASRVGAILNSNGGGRLQQWDQLDLLSDTGNGVIYDDSFLLSIDELDLRDNYRHFNIGGFSSDEYWSSTESMSGEYVYGIDFGSYQRYNYPKNVYINDAFRVRPIRAFLHHPKCIISI